VVFPHHAVVPLLQQKDSRGESLEPGGTRSASN